jgi:4-carboxymuconolactone decarboxylase
MTEEERFARGLEVRETVHADVLPALPENAGTYAKLSVRNIYNDIWGREVMSVRDRRLSVMGALAAMTLIDPLETHLRSALALKELSWEEVDEFAIAVSPYIGAPRTTYVLQLIGKLKAELARK